MNPSRRRTVVVLGVLGVLSTLSTLVIASAGAEVAKTKAAPSAPRLVMTRGPYHAGQLITIAAGPNKFFRPYGSIKVIECADPGGSPANLPRDESTCDGNTIQGPTVLVARNGSFRARAYPLYQLPSPVLGETAAGRPICNRTHACVLYIGENQSNFSWPKEFSPSFRLSPAPGSGR